MSPSSAASLRRWLIAFLKFQSAPLAWDCAAHCTARTRPILVSRRPFVGHARRLITQGGPTQPLRSAVIGSEARGGQESLCATPTESGSEGGAASSESHRKLHAYHKNGWLVAASFRKLEKQVRTRQSCARSLKLRPHGCVKIAHWAIFWVWEWIWCWCNPWKALLCGWAGDITKLVRAHALLSRRRASSAPRAAAFVPVV